MVAVSLPLQSTQPLSNFKTQIEGHENNLHCVTMAVSDITAAVHTNMGRWSSRGGTTDMQIFVTPTCIISQFVPPVRTTGSHHDAIRKSTPPNPSLSPSSHYWFAPRRDQEESEGLHGEAL